VGRWETRSDLVMVRLFEAAVNPNPPKQSQTEINHTS